MCSNKDTESANLAVHKPLAMVQPAALREKLECAAISGGRRTLSRTLQLVIKSPSSEYRDRHPAANRNAFQIGGIPHVMGPVRLRRSG